MNDNNGPSILLKGGIYKVFLILLLLFSLYLGFSLIQPFLHPGLLLRSTIKELCAKIAPKPAPAPTPRTSPTLSRPPRPGRTGGDGGARARCVVG